MTEMFKVRKDPWVSLRYWSVWNSQLMAGHAGVRLPTFWARNGIFHGLRLMGIASGDHVLVPSYICRAAVEPILATGAAIDYYAVKRDCRIDFDDVVSRIRPTTKALLAVHYFGFPQEIERVRGLCAEYGLKLIEDCAHVLQGEYAGRPLGSFGDISVFSWRKFLPVYDGADLVLNGMTKETNLAWADEPRLFTIKVAKNVLEGMLGFSLGGSVRRIMAEVGILRSSGADSAALPLTVTTGTDTFDNRLVNWRMSRLSRWIKAHADVRAIVMARRKHYRYLQERLSKIARIKLLHAELPDGVCPWVLPFTVDEMDNVHLELRHMGIPATTWGGVRPPQLPRAEYNEAEFLYDRLIFLPIHQSLTESDLDLMAASVSKVCGYERQDVANRHSV